jgi:hypothetical protein
MHSIFHAERGEACARSTVRVKRVASAASLVDRWNAFGDARPLRHGPNRSPGGRQPQTTMGWPPITQAKAGARFLVQARHDAVAHRGGQGGHRRRRTRARIMANRWAIARVVVATGGAARADSGRPPARELSAGRPAWKSPLVLRFVFVTAVGVWLGTVVCFSFVILPAIHDGSAPGDATRLLRRLFPRYYVAGIVCGFIALAVVSLARSAGTLPIPDALRLALPVAGGLLCSLVAHYVLQPRMRDAHDRNPERYARLHSVSTMLNSTVLALLLLAVAGAVMR